MTRTLKQIVLSLGLGFACHVQAIAGGQAVMQDPASFAAAFDTISTSPPYVMITVVDDRTGQSRTVCTISNFLLGAIHHEYGLGYDREGQLKAASIARDSKDHIFHFRKREALDNIPVKYSEDQLAAARQLLAPLSTDELKAKFSTLYANQRLPTEGYARDAIACALIERGFAPRMADISGQVYIGR